jgi:hypothetical protein
LRAWVRNDGGLREISQAEYNRLKGQIRYDFYPFIIMEFHIFADRKRVVLGRRVARNVGAGCRYIVQGEGDERKLGYDPTGGTWFLEHPATDVKETEVQRWDSKKGYASIPRPSEYRTASGDVVLLHRLHIREFLLGVLEGHPDCWRITILQDVPRLARELYPGPHGLLVKGLAEGIIPRYIFFAEVGDYYSGLIVCWFGDDLSNLEEGIAENLLSVDWFRNAVRYPQ